ncbi:MAG: thiol peroxidase [Burkholderiales bacterium]|jgi:thiol peroxidase|nr:thiol peroxidase [Burkholderiales bacterium]
MSRTMLSLLAAAALCANVCAQAADTVQADLPVDKGTVSPGDGNFVTMKKDTKLPLSGSGVVEIGKPMPSAMVVGGDMKPVDIGQPTGKVRIISVVPSVDTKTCEKQTHQLSEDNKGLDKQVEMITVSRDLPFAQGRFAKEAKIKNVTFLSDYNMREFGDKNGLNIAPIGLLARAVIVTDKDNIVRYIQVVPEITALPDMQAAMKAARELL